MTARRGLAIALVGAIAPTAAACGGGGSPLEQAEKHLADLHSGRLDLAVRLVPSDPAGAIGVRLQGPFSLSGKMPLPVADITVTELRGRSRVRTRFVSTGRRALVVAAGRTVALTGRQLAGLRVGSGPARSLEDLGLHVTRWLDQPRTTRATLSGAGVDVIRGRLDVVRVLEDLRRAGASPGGIGPTEARRLARTVDASEARLVVGHDDHLLRRLRASVHLTLPPELRRAGSPGVALTVEMDLAVSRPNEAVRTPALPPGATAG